MLEGCTQDVRCKHFEHHVFHTVFERAKHSAVHLNQVIFALVFEFSFYKTVFLLKTVENYLDRSVRTSICILIWFNLLI